MKTRACFGIILAAVCSVSLLARSLAAQIPPPPPTELKKLAFFIGEAAGKGKMYPPGGAGTVLGWSSAERCSWAIGGYYLRLESKVTYQGMPPMDGIVMMGYDPKEKVYRIWAFAPHGPTPMEASGNFEGSKLVLTSKPMDFGMGTMAVVRMSFEPVSKGDVNYLMEVKMGEKWEKLEDGVYTKKK